MPAGRHFDSTPDSRRVRLCSRLPCGSYRFFLLFVVDLVVVVVVVVVVAVVVVVVVVF